jgi:hypothetical protein
MHTFLRRAYKYRTHEVAIVAPSVVLTNSPNSFVLIERYVTLGLMQRRIEVVTSAAAPAEGILSSKS